VFIVKRGQIFTPPITAGALRGITRAVVFEIAAETGIKVSETDITRHDVFIADECFLTGTAAEIIPVVKADGRPIGTSKPGPTGFALADLLLGIGAAEEIEKGSSTQRCPVCGFTQADFKKTGRLGCSTCYATFTEALTALLKAMHKGTAHVGKVPQRAHRAGELTDKWGIWNEGWKKEWVEEIKEQAGI